MKTCPNCSKQLPDYATKCKYCDTLFTEQAPAPVQVKQHAMKECYRCKSQIRADAITCPHCGKDPGKLATIGEQMSKAGLNMTVATVLGVILLCIIVIVIASLK